MLLYTFIMFAALLQQAPDAAKPEIAVLKAGVGTCAADFLVKDSSGKPANSATIHTKIRYGAMSVKRMDLEVSTNADGKARIEGLPNKARPLVYDIEKAGEKAKVPQNVATSCLTSLDVVLK